MKKIILLSLTLFSLQATSFQEILLAPAAKTTAVHAVGVLTLAGALCGLGETLLDCGHGYYEIKQEYAQYIKELEALEKDKKYHEHILTENEMRFWATVQGISRIPKVFWREFFAGTASLYALGLAYKALTYKNL